jgi:hypothetical protein
MHFFAADSLSVGIGDQTAVADLSDCERHIVAPSREVHENPPVGHDADARRHCPWKFKHTIQIVRCVGNSAAETETTLSRSQPRAGIDDSSKISLTLRVSRVPRPQASF